VKIKKVDRDYLRDYAENNNIFVEATFELTTNCNLSCLHCYNDIYIEDAPITLIYKTIDKLSELGVIFITLTGGEVLLRKDFREIYFYLKHKGFLITIFTNGTLLNLNDFIFNNKPLNLSLSIYGVNENEYSSFTNKPNCFKKIIEGLDSLYQNGIPFELKVILTKCNYETARLGLYDDFALRYNKSIKYSYILSASKKGNKDFYNFRLSTDEAVAFLKSRKSFFDSKILKIKNYSPITYNCAGGSSSLNVNANCEIGICMKDLGYTVSIETQISDIIKKIKKRKNKIIEESKLMPCYKCPINFGCINCPVEEKFNKDDGFMCALQHKIADR
jgi:MoaA/NifB/PqqE/SkfB family radical SAM enzyme